MFQFVNRVIRNGDFFKKKSVDHSYNYKKILIIGGGNIGFHLAKMLEENFDIVLIMIKKNLATKFVSISFLIFGGSISAEIFQDS